MKRELTDSWQLMDNWENALWKSLKICVLKLLIEPKNSTCDTFFCWKVSEVNSERQWHQDPAVHVRHAHPDSGLGQCGLWADDNQLQVGLRGRARQVWRDIISKVAKIPHLKLYFPGSRNSDQTLPFSSLSSGLAGSITGLSLIIMCSVKRTLGKCWEPVKIKIVNVNLHFGKMLRSLLID